MSGLMSIGFGRWTLTQLPDDVSASDEMGPEKNLVKHERHSMLESELDAKNRSTLKQ